MKILILCLHEELDLCPGLDLELRAHVPGPANQLEEKVHLIFNRRIFPTFHPLGIRRQAYRLGMDLFVARELLPKLLGQRTA